MMKKLILSLSFMGLMAVGSHSQTNLLSNSDARIGLGSWIASGDAKFEQGSDENPNFAVRNDGSFFQKIKVDLSGGKFVLLIGRGTVDNVNQNRILTGLPSLYGYLYSGPDEINTYLTGQRLLGRPMALNEWVVMYGVFRVPDGTIAAQIMLTQASRRGEPNDGTATRFDDIGLYVFDTEAEAIAFAQKYK